MQRWPGDDAFGWDRVWRAQGGRLFNPRPQIDVELADCMRRIELTFRLSTPAERANAFHKVDTLIAALTALRAGLAAEGVLFRERERRGARMGGRTPSTGYAPDGPG